MIFILYVNLFVDQNMLLCCLKLLLMFIIITETSDKIQFDTKFSISRQIFQKLERGRPVVPKAHWS